MWSSKLAVVLLVFGLRVSTWALSEDHRNRTDVPAVIGVKTIRRINCTIDDVRDLSSKGENVAADSEDGYIGGKLNLELNKCTLSTLSDGFIATLGDLVHHLSLEECGVTAVDESAFNGLTALQTLTITGNQIRELGPWSVDNLDQIVLLDVQRNGIHTIDIRGLNRYPNLQRLNAAFNRIETVPDGVFKHTPHIKWLNLEGNSIQRIEPFTFKPLLKLNHLFLQNNKIHSINSYALTTTSQLKTLRLDGNRIEDLDILFYNLPKLTVLNISDNRLGAKAIEENVFHQNGELNFLDLSFNKLKDIQIGAFKGLETLEVGRIHK